MRRRGAFLMVGFGDGLGWVVAFAGAGGFVGVGRRGDAVVVVADAPVGVGVTAGRLDRLDKAQNRLRDPSHPQLSTRSDDFRRMWAAQSVRHHRGGLKRLRHLVVGDLDLVFEAVTFPADPDLAVSTYVAPPDSPSSDALRVLASWSAVPIAEHDGLRP